MNSYFGYTAGDATAGYRGDIDEAAKKVQAHKNRTDPIYHDKIDRMFDSYCKKLADVMNHGFAIDTRCPSLLVAGPSNFPARKKEKQNAARSANMKDWQGTQDYLRSILSVGKAGISSDDGDAVPKLKKKLESLQEEQEDMKRVNAYFRKNKTLDNCPGLSWESIQKLKAEMSRDRMSARAPYLGWMLTNNNGNMARIKERIAELEKKATADYSGWSFDGGTVEFDKEDNRIRLLYDGKPDEAERAKLKGHGFRWSPKNSAWQRQITNNAIYDAKQITGKK
jgi:hypothetical protein